MALFNRNRDVLLVNSINRELIKDIVSQQIGYYKYILSENTTNLYGESVEKFLDSPVLLNCLIKRGDQDWESGDIGPDVSRKMDFAIFRQDLVDIELVPTVGDIILYLNRYYEVDGIIENQLFGGKDPSYPYSEGLSKYGSSISIICRAHLIPADKLGITEER